MLQQTQPGATRSVAPEFPSGVPARATATPGRFRRRTTLDDANDRSGLVARAIARGKEGDPEAIRFLYQRYADNVYGYVCSIVRDEHEAEDVTQNVFAKLMTNLCKYEPRAVPFSAWILRVARNAAMDHLRARRMIPCEEVRDPAAHADDTGRLRRASLRQALGDLPDEQRRVLVLRHLVGLSPGEIAESMGKTEGSVHALHHRGRRSLQQSLVRLEAAPSLRTVPVPAAVAASQ